MEDNRNWNKALELYLTGEWGQLVAFEGDEPCLVNSRNAADITVPCPGGNYDTTLYCQDFVELNDDGLYVTIETPWQDAGRVVGTWEDVVRETIQDGDVIGDIEGLQARFEDAREEEDEQNRRLQKNLENDWFTNPNL
jgi:hypothetical protein